MDFGKHPPQLRLDSADLTRGKEPSDIFPAPVDEFPVRKATVHLRDLSTTTRVPKRNTKKEGDVSEARVIVALAEAGYAVAIPFGENQRYDLIADDGNRMLRVQVKTGRLRGGVIIYACCSSHAHRGGAPRPYFGEVDLFAVYCPETRKVYLLPESQLVASRAHLRVDPTKNGMRKGIRWAHDFELA